MLLRGVALLDSVLVRGVVLLDSVMLLRGAVLLDSVMLVRGVVLLVSVVLVTQQQRAPAWRVPPLIERRQLPRLRRPLPGQPRGQPTWRDNPRGPGGAAPCPALAAFVLAPEGAAAFPAPEGAAAASALRAAEAELRAAEPDAARHHRRVRSASSAG